jgi:hypothetical protein
MFFYVVAAKVMKELGTGTCFIEIDNGGNPSTSPEVDIWLDVYKQLTDREQNQFSQVSKGAYALGYSPGNKSSLFHRGIRARRLKVRDLLYYVVKQRNLYAAESMLIADPAYRLYKASNVCCYR